MQRDINTEQWRERLVDAHCGDIEHGRRYGGTRGGIGDEADSLAHHLHECGVCAVGAYCEDALVCVVEVHALEDIAEPRQLAKTTVAYGPVGQQP